MQKRNTIIQFIKAIFIEYQKWWKNLSLYKNEVFWLNINCNVIFQISIKENDVVTSLIKTEDDLYLPIRIFVRVYVC